jgi:predicted AlkP superfamily pyrophosphatase or phosphodiesterase
MVKSSLFRISAIGLIFIIGCASVTPVVTNQPVSEANRRPKLIMGVTVDQMRYDYIEKFWNDFGDKGFKRLLGDGFFCRNLKYNYMPTYTGPGHASIFTGTTPAFHGIIQNDWFERSSGLTIYCSSDSTATGVGTSSAAGKMSPQYLLASTIGDELKIFSNNRSKVFGIAMKDRGAILPAGRTADAAYWFVGGTEGVWATSNWYMNDLPTWVKDFNASGKATNYINQTWNLALDEARYDESMQDNNAYEAPFKGVLRPVFPYNLSELRASNGNFDLIKATPFGNDLTVDFAKELIEKEGLGVDEFTDMLCMSFSSTDYIGHQFGIHSRELQDCYIRLDKLLGEFLDYLDQKVGRENYLLFLSADHGGAPTPSYMMTEKASAGYWERDKFVANLQSWMKAHYGEGEWIINESNQNIFLNRKLIEEKKLDLNEIQNATARYVADQTHVHAAFAANQLNGYNLQLPIMQMAQLGFSQKMNGDVIYILDPNYMQYGMMGTTHGSPYVYDSHVPAIFFGSGIKHGESHSPYFITDIAPTVSAACKISFPNACIGIPITEALKD